MTVRRIFVVCGVRPHYVKWAALESVLHRAGLIVEMVDSRQHYDPDLTDLLLDDLGLSAAVTFAHSSTDAHDRGGHIYSEMCKLLESSSQHGLMPGVIVFGDVTSTVMSALAASRVGSLVVHVEAGVRSGAGTSGESVENRIRRVTAQLSSLNLCVLPDHVENLRREDAQGESLWTGDLGREYLLSLAAGSGEFSDFVLAHIHKAENTHLDTMRCVFNAIAQADMPTAFIVHPTVRPLIAEGVVAVPPNVTLRDPMSYTRLVRAMSTCRLVLTDSGGVQREAYHLGKRCVVRRDTVGWSDLVSEGGHVRVPATVKAIRDALLSVWDSPAWVASCRPAFDRPGGTMEAAAAILRTFV